MAMSLNRAERRKRKLQDKYKRNPIARELWIDHKYRKRVIDKDTEGRQGAKNLIKELNEGRLDDI